MMWMRAAGLSLGQLSPTMPTLAYLGNSVTAQRYSYVDPLHELLRKHWGVSGPPRRAGVGGVGSLALAGLLDSLVLRHQPTHCFVECSLADAGGATPIHSIRLALLSILGDLLSVGVVPILLHLPRQDVEPSAHARVIQIYSEVAKELRVAEIDLRWLGTHGDFRDGVHPSQAMSEIIAKCVADAVLSNVVEGAVHPVRISAQRVRLHAASSGNLMRGRIRHSKFRFSLPTVIVEAEGAWGISAENSTFVGLYVIAGPASGVIQVSAGNASMTVQLWDEWCVRPRIQFITFPQNMMLAQSLKLDVTLLELGERNAIGEPSALVHRGSTLEIVGGAVIVNTAEMLIDEK